MQWKCCETIRKAKELHRLALLRKGVAMLCDAKEQQRYAAQRIGSEMIRHGKAMLNGAMRRHSMAKLRSAMEWLGSV